MGRKEKSHFKGYGPKKAGDGSSFAKYLLPTGIINSTSQSDYILINVGVIIVSIL